MSSMQSRILASALGLALAAAAPAGARAADHIIAVSKPNNVFLIDAAARKVVKECKIPGRGSPLTVSPSPDGRIAYLVTNGWGEVSGINLDNCEEVFHADMSEGNIRGKTIGAMTVSRDGKELFALQSRVELLTDRYNILPHRIAVYDTAAGKDAKPIRTFDVPRGLSIMVPAVDGKHLWAAGHDMYKIEAATGTIVETHPILYWQDQRPTYGLPDGLAFWPLYETTEKFIVPYVAPKFASKEDRDAGDLAKATEWVLGVSMADLKTNEWVQTDVAPFEVIIFSMALSPTDPNIMYGAYTTLNKYDLAQKKVLKQVELDHTYYAVITSTDGKELYVGSTNDDIAVYSAETLDKLANIKLPGGGDQGAATIRVVQR